MRILQTNFYGDHNLGLFAKASDKICLANLPEKLEKAVENVLKVDIVKVNIAKTDLVGIFCCMNSNGILLPKIVSGYELENCKKICKKLGLNLEILKSKFTALGNLILANDHGAVISRNFSRRNKKNIEDCLGVDSEYCTVAGMDIVGSCGVATNKGCIVHRDASDKEVEVIEDVLKVPVDIGTANFGSPFIGSCFFGNSNGIVIGESTTGPEVTRIMESLKLL